MRLRRKKPDNSGQAAARLRPQPAVKAQRYTYFSDSQSAQTGRNQAEAETLQMPGRLRLLPTIIAVGVIVISVAYSLTLSPKPAIRLVDGQEAYYRETTAYQDRAQQLLSDKLSSRLKLTVQTEPFEAAFMQVFPEVRSAVLRLPVLGRKPTLVLELRQPSLLLATPGKNYVLDSTGVVVTEARNVSNDIVAALPVVRDETGLPISAGNQALTGDSIRFINEVRNQLSAKQLQVQQLRLPPVANQLDILIEGVPYFVKTDMAGNAVLQMGSLLAVQNNLKEQGITPSAYIDVRVEEKVFYK